MLLIDLSRILEKFLKWRQHGRIHPIQHIVSLPAYRIDREFQSLKIDRPIEIPTSTASDDLSKVKASVKRRELSLDMEAAYLLTGGLEGLGMALVYRLVEHGARTLVIISRSAGRSNESKNFMLEMASLGCSIIAVSGEVNSQEDVDRAVAEVGRPIKGVVHMAMVLRVNSVP